jgi:uncharacterized protein (DUF433 family)
LDTSQLQRIAIEPSKRGGRPCIRGKRMRVTDVLDLLASGASIDEIVEDCQTPWRDDVLAAIDYAALQTRHTVIGVALDRSLTSSFRLRSRGG